MLTDRADRKLAQPNHTLAAKLESLTPFGTDGCEPLPDFERRLAQAVTPLPGSVPYRNVRTFSVTGRYDHSTLGCFLTGRYPHIEPGYWQTEVAEGRLRIDGRTASAWQFPVRAGMRIAHDVGETVEPTVATAMTVLYNDRHFVALSKSAPLPVHPSGRFNRNTLVSLLQTVWPGSHLRPPHRLDADTSGVQLLGKSREAARALTRQFAARAVEKQYLARVEGHPAWDEYEADEPIGRETGPAGRRSLGAGDAALTRLSCLTRWPDGTALALAQPLTGRTNQVRLHLHACGHPICGDPVYGGAESEGGRAGDSLERAFSHGTLELHALSLTFDHPADGHRMRLLAQPPAWAFNGSDSA